MAGCRHFLKRYGMRSYEVYATKSVHWVPAIWCAVRGGTPLGSYSGEMYGFGTPSGSASQSSAILRSSP